MMFTYHTRIALLTFLLILLWASVRFVANEKETAMIVEPMQIGIEHDTAAAITLTKTIDRQPQFIDISNEGNETVRISLPETFKRGEVRGVPLSSIMVDEPLFGYQRWHLPAGATLSFQNPLPWTGMNIQNPSGLPLRLQVINVHLARDTTERETYLLSEKDLLLP